MDETKLLGILLLTFVSLLPFLASIAGMLDMKKEINELDGYDDKLEVDCSFDKIIIEGENFKCYRDIKEERDELNDFLTQYAILFMVSGIVLFCGVGWLVVFFVKKKFESKKKFENKKEMKGDLSFLLRRDLMVRRRWKKGKNKKWMKIKKH